MAKINSMALADEAFVGSQALNPDAANLLDKLVCVMEAVEDQGLLQPEVPNLEFEPQQPEYVGWGGIRVELPERVEDLPEQTKLLIRCIRVAAGELARLHRFGSHSAIASLGYAVHPLPQIILVGGVFSSREFQFCFRVAASHWAELSEEMREALVDLAKLRPDQVERLMGREDFAINMYPHLDEPNR